MRLRNILVSMAAAAMLSGVPAFAQTEFSALQGVEVQALSADEMQAISGQLNAYDIAAALLAKAATLDAFPRLQAGLIQLANYYLTNAEQINALFAKFGVLTPCQSC